MTNIENDTRSLLCSPQFPLQTVLQAVKQVDYNKGILKLSNYLYILVGAESIKIIAVIQIYMELYCINCIIGGTQDRPCRSSSG
jgi:hypothetical protein